MVCVCSTKRKEDPTPTTGDCPSLFLKAMLSITAAALLLSPSVFDLFPRRRRLSPPHHTRRGAFAIGRGFCLDHLFQSVRKTEPPLPCRRVVPGRVSVIAGRRVRGPTNQEPPCVRPCSDCSGPGALSESNVGSKCGVQFRLGTGALTESHVKTSRPS